MNYKEAVEYLYNAAPLFQNIGAGAYKEGLENTQFIDQYYGHPHQAYRTIHVAGTNGKGSVSHTLASILQSAGLRVGLYTSPHMVDFRERIRVNGQMIPRERVIRFVEEDCPTFEKLSPSFFELTTGLAFKFFEEEKVDIAVIEVGLGGRLDCTNIITPILSVITNISFDHTQFLGNTLPLIASEKAGIIKEGVPVVIGETNGNDDVKNVFTRKALETKSRICFADETNEVISSSLSEEGKRIYETLHYGKIVGDLGGVYQEKNLATVLAAVTEIKKVVPGLTDDVLRKGIRNCTSLTGLMGRWQTLSSQPRIICDTGHNVAGLRYVTQQLRQTPHKTLYIVIGMVSDKDISTVLTLLPKDATYLFTQASVKRAMPVDVFAEKAAKAGLRGTSFPNVPEAYRAAKAMATADDLIFVGGSSYIVADLFTYLQEESNKEI